ncbi:hypothetical protein Y032_0019g3904 [Ancylostoma ceylanicum]|uniref:Uncharacterized protein n=1 Tax=Ancylostoma ceylanicum TaxID=53326 RepID=A0A016V2W0_9BILA|nr:hypothetical protein Y032_0019g3904 [Ancylostoma ceylanicum]
MISTEIFQHDRRVARAAHIRSWRKDLEFELEKERREDYESEMSSEKRRAIKGDLAVQATQSSSEHATRTERTEKERDASEEVVSMTIKNSTDGSIEKSAARRKGKKINASEGENPSTDKSATRQKEKKINASEGESILTDKSGATQKGRKTNTSEGDNVLTDKSAAAQKGKKANASERERLLSGKSGKSSKRIVSMYADAKLYG